MGYDMTEEKIDVENSGSRTLRFVGVEGFAQRKPKVETEETEADATNDDTGRESVIGGDLSQSDG